MKYENLTHEERELVLFIENNQIMYNRVALKPSFKRVRDAVDMYKRLYAKQSDVIFNTDNIKNVNEYLQTRKDN